MLNVVDGLADWKKQIKTDIDEKISAKLDSKDEEIQKLTQANAAKDVELEKMKIRLAILEQKLKSNNVPSLDNIDDLFTYINLSKSATLKQIREAIKYRLYEVSPESPIDSSVTRNMTKEERENMSVYLNQVQCTLLEWKKNQQK